MIKKTRKRRTHAPEGCEIVYGLICPTSGLIRYVGLTSDSLQGRLGNHLAWINIRNGTNRPFAEWKANLLIQGLKPIAVVLDFPGVLVARETEALWIKRMHAISPLLNIIGID